MLALACHSLGAWQEGHAHEKERQSLADGTLDVDQAFDVHLCLWEYHLYGDQGSGGIRTAVDQMLEQARRMKAPRAVALCENFAGTVDFLAGRWDEADGQLRRAIEGFRLVGSASGEALSLQRLAILLHGPRRARRGASAPRRGDRGRRAGGDALALPHAPLCVARAQSPRRGRSRERCESLQEGLAEASRHGHCATCNSLLLPEAVRVELASGNVSRGRRIRASARRRRPSLRQPRVDGDGRARARTRLRGAWRRRRRRVTRSSRARQAFDEIGSPYEAARCAMAASRLPGAREGPATERAALAQARADDLREARRESTSRL